MGEAADEYLAATFREGTTAEVDLESVVVLSPNEDVAASEKEGAAVDGYGAVAERVGTAVEGD